MKRVCFILLFFSLYLKCWSQKQFEKNVYLMLHIGTGMTLNQPAERANNFLQGNYVFWEKGSIFVEIKNNFGLHLNVQGVGYSHKINENFITSNNPGFDDLGVQHYFNNSKFPVLTGISYKYNYKRLIIMPFIDVGFIPFAKSSNKIDVLLKEQNSNNIRKITYQFSHKVKRFDYTFGADLCFHFKRWGLSSSFQFDRFKSICDVQSLTADYFSEDKIENFSIDFHYLSLLCSLGLFISF